MKSKIITLSLLSMMSLSASSDEIMTATYGEALLNLSSISGTTNSKKECEITACKEALKVLDDAQDYAQSGKLSVLLNQKIIELQSQKELSVEEALDILIDGAQTILN